MMSGGGDVDGEKVVMSERIKWSLSNVSLSSCDESIGRQRHKVGMTKVHSETRHTVVAIREAISNQTLTRRQPLVRSESCIRC